MPFIEIVADDEASVEAAELFEADRARVGYIPNYARLFAHRGIRVVFVGHLRLLVWVR